MKSFNVSLIGAFFFSMKATAPLRASIINFDDIDASLGDVPLDDLRPYEGLNWANFTAYTSVPGFPGFNNRIVSPPNAAYTTGDALVAPIISTITRANRFDFTSAHLGSGWYNDFSVPLNGLTNGIQDFNHIVTINTEAPQFFMFNFTGITEFDIFSTSTASTTDPYGCGRSGCSQVTLDDLNVMLLNPTSESGVFVPLCLAFAALAASPRLRK